MESVKRPKTDEEKRDIFFQRKVAKRMGKAISDFELIEDGDRIMVGVSGGKDSLALLELLALRRKFKKQNFEVIAVHINVLELPYQVDKDFLDEFCRKLDVPMVYRDINVDFERPSKKPACFRCSWHRRTTLFKMTDELKCNKLALGHHMDDALETLLMNMMYQGAVCSMPAKLSMFQGNIILIRPLIYLRNEEMREYSRISNFVLEKERCPHEDVTKRKETNKLIDRLAGDDERIRTNLFRSMSNVQTEYLPIIPKKDKLQ
ncbi:tRNA(Ile)-lysidine synthetase-like protein [Ancylomarina subtilis]|uniref:tRNA(Ile)-lysidine synthetase-like protein n=1 Tax=Ancylomarina subtilis TaxID=1639035 RepID=A0A4V6MEK1_9BACT|nr:ATP-binding protein [Ancylomarina subtilis]RZT96545.1 tRNA(Ile)-lysidine synthetase-like protein [Ancylomarina subtilis]